MMESLNKYFLKNPPIHLMIKNYLGYKNEDIKNNNNKNLMMNNLINTKISNKEEFKFKTRTI